METLVKVATPLPADVIGNIIRAIGAVYPNAQLEPDAVGRFFVIAISDEDRAAPATEIEVEKVPRDEQVEMLLSSFTESGFGISAGEWYSKLMVGAFKQVLDEHGPENYVEQELFDSESGERYVVAFCRSSEQTPHELRLRAEAELVQARARISELERQLEASRDE